MVAFCVACSAHLLALRLHTRSRACVLRTLDLFACCARVICLRAAHAGYRPHPFGTDSVMTLIACAIEPNPPAFFSFSPRGDAFDGGAKRVEAFVDAFVAAFDLLGVVDGPGAFGAERGQQHRHAGADIGAFDAGAAHA